MAHPYDDRYREGHHGYRSERGPGRDDRGLLERAGDEVRSWFGDDDAERRRRMDEERHRHERMTSERGWTGGERWEGSDRWRHEPDRWRTDSDRSRSDYGRSEYDRPGRTWNESGQGRTWTESSYGRMTDEGRPMYGDRWRGSDSPREYDDRWRNEATWGPATWSQGERWRRESSGGGGYGDRWSRESGWGAWPREQGSWQGYRATGGSRGIYEDDRGQVYQFGHGAPSNFSGRGPKGYRRSDERIREEICDRLTDDWRVDATEIDVVVNGGQVTLSGAVQSREEKRKAEDLVESIPGVHDVHNNLRVGHWDESRNLDRTGSGMNAGTPQTNTSNTTTTRR
jgi:osmotically-inducible protein OsmY